MFNERLRDERCKLGYSQKALAQKIGISQQAYAKYELGTSTPNPDTLKKLSEILGVSVDYLLGWEDAKRELKKFGHSLQEIADELDISLSHLSEIIKNNNVEVLEKITKVANIIAQQPILENLLLKNFDLLNDEGKLKVIEYAEDLSLNPFYQAKDDDDNEE